MNTIERLTSVLTFTLSWPASIGTRDESGTKFTSVLEESMLGCLG